VKNNDKIRRDKFIEILVIIKNLSPAQIEQLYTFLKKIK